jgi:hypothetical protein
MVVLVLVVMLVLVALVLESCVYVMVVVSVV